MEFSQPIPISIEPLCAIPMEIDFAKNDATTINSMYVNDSTQNFREENALIPRNFHAEPSPSKRSPHFPARKAKTQVKKQLNVALIAERLALAESREEILACEVKMTYKFALLY